MITMPEKEKGGYWTPLEKEWRDYFLSPITFLFRPFSGAANAITFLGFAILAVAMIDFFRFGSFERQIWFILAAWLTDFIDGPTARNNRHVTPFGTAADFVRDDVLSVWMLAVSLLAIKANGGYASLYLLVALTLLGKFAIAAAIWLYGREKRRERPDQPFSIFFHEFIMKDFVTTVTARIHTFILAAGGIAVIAGAAWGNPYSELGIGLLLLQLLILGFYLHELFEAQYEDKAYRLRVAFKEKMRDLEERRREKRQ